MLICVCVYTKKCMSSFALLVYSQRALCCVLFIKCVYLMWSSSSNEANPFVLSQENDITSKLVQMTSMMAVLLDVSIHPLICQSTLLTGRVKHSYQGHICISRSQVSWICPSLALRMSVKQLFRVEMHCCH